MNASHHAACRTSHPRPRCGSFSLASSSLSFAGAGRRQIYALIERVLRTQKYLGLTKKDKGIVRRYLVKISGLSVGPNQPLDRPLARLRRHPAASLAAPPLPNPLQARRYPAAGQSRWRPRRPLRPGPCAAYCSANSRSTAWPPTNDWPPSRPRNIYNLRRSRTYRETAPPSHQDRASAVNIGERRKPRSAWPARPPAGRHRAPGRHPEKARVFITSMPSTR